MPDRFDEILAQMRDDRVTTDRAREEMGRELAALGERIDRKQDQTDENLRFLGELNRRCEIVLQDVLREGRAMRAEIRAETAEIKASTAELKALTETTKALTETTKAHTRAIFAVIDRLEGGGGGLAPAT